jgi:hypothetical protein
MQTSLAHPPKSNGEHHMNKSFLTATAFAALIGFSSSGAMAQQSAPSLDAPAIQKSAPVESGKSGAASGTMQNKSSTTMKQGAAAPVDSKTKRDATATTQTKTNREAARACATVKDKASHDACVSSHTKNDALKNQPAKNSAAGTVSPDKTKPAPRVGG